MDRSTRPRLFGWRGATLIAVGLVVGSLVLAPGIGIAAKFLTKQQVKKRYLGNTVIVTQNGSAPNTAGTPVTLNCPSGLQATGGGATAPGVYNASTVTNFLIVLEDRPINAGRSVGWYLEVVGQGSPAPVPFTAFAVCSK
ncbi:MAG TPA: hypothetical protein VHH92_03370 [Actinomycetota bacterium]|nr:hypothetical protein [Actinomycetota bacterium]